MSLGEGAGTETGTPPPAAAGGAPPPAAPPAATGTPPPSNTGNLGQGAPGSSDAKSWRDSLPDDLKSDPTLNKYSDLPNLAKAHIELQKKIGEKGIFKPKADASPEEIKAFREAMGIPTDPAKYDMGKFEGVEVPEVTVAWAKEQGAKLGIEPSAFKELMTSYMQLEAKNEADMAVAAKEDIKAGFDSLRKDWGDAFEQKIQRANIAAKAIETKGGAPGFIERLKEFGADNDPLILKGLDYMASLLGEDTLRESGVTEGRQSPNEIQAELSRVRNELMSMPKTDGRRPALLTRLESLSKQATGGR